MKKSLISLFFLTVYSMFLVKLMVFKDVPMIRIGQLRLSFGGTQVGAANLVPFKTILPYLLGEKGWMIAGINLLGNIILLIPVGFLIPLVYKKITWKKMLLVAIAAGFAIEGMQVVLSVGIFDIDDVILNGLGVMTGYWIFLTLARWVELRQYKLIVITTMLVLTVAAASVYFIYPKGQQPFNEREDVGPILYGQVDSGSIKTSARRDQDPCNGTGGTGQIMTAGNNTITIKRRDGVNQKITLTDHTAIRTAAGTASQSDLKIGDRVTVIVDDSETASTILICNATILQSVK